VGASTPTVLLGLPDGLLRRVAAVADAEGKTPYAFMLEAIELQTQFAESRRDFVASVQAAEGRASQYACLHTGNAAATTTIVEGISPGVSHAAPPTALGAEVPHRGRE
jgi:hypothetical protein